MVIAGGDFAPEESRGFAVAKGRSVVLVDMSSGYYDLFRCLFARIED